MTEYISISSTTNKEDLLRQWQIFGDSHFEETCNIKGLSIIDKKIVAVLIHHLDAWKKTGLHDISIFKQVFQSVDQHALKGLLVHVLYECMEKNANNYEILHPHIETLTSAQLDSFLGLLTTTYEKEPTLLNLYQKLDLLDKDILDMYIYPKMLKIMNLLLFLNKSNAESKHYSEHTNKKVLNHLRAYVFSPPIISALLNAPNVRLRGVIHSLYAEILISPDTRITLDLLAKPNDPTHNIKNYIVVLEYIKSITKNAGTLTADGLPSIFSQLKTAEQPLTRAFALKYPEYHSLYQMYAALNLDSLETLVDSVLSKDIQLNNEELPFTI